MVTKDLEQRFLQKTLPSVQYIFQVTGRQCSNLVFVDVRLPMLNLFPRKKTVEKLGFLLEMFWASRFEFSRFFNSKVRKIRRFFRKVIVD